MWISVKFTNEVRIAIEFFYLF
ncbi:hypothetical protein PUN4_890024 [Paraburkholderia unamae]|nr:hypothetical protein PUN4_890024 [Paraburkholderia unamae]